jgi:hypothetical protein
MTKHICSISRTSRVDYLIKAVEAGEDVAGQEFNIKSAGVTHEEA